MIKKKTRRQKLLMETLDGVSHESRAVIEGLLQVVAALKNQPGFDVESFDTEMHTRMRDVPPGMDVAVLMMAAAAALPSESSRSSPYTPRHTSLLRQ